MTDKYNGRGTLAGIIGKLHTDRSDHESLNSRYRRHRRNGVLHERSIHELPPTPLAQEAEGSATRARELPMWRSAA